MKKQRQYKWDLVDSPHWRTALRRIHPFYRGIVRRVYPKTEDYHKTVLLRYESLVEDGLIDPAKFRIEEMVLTGDPNNVILGFFKKGRICATITLTRITQQFSQWLLIHQGANEQTRTGRHGMALLLDTADILCVGMKKQGLIGIVPHNIAYNLPEARIPEGWRISGKESLLKTPELSAVISRLNIENGSFLLIEKPNLHIA